MRPVVDRDAVRAGAVGLAVDGVLAVEHLGEDARGRGLARAARTAEEVGVADAVLGHRGAQRPHDVVLARAARRSASTGSAGTAPGTRHRPTYRAATSLATERGGHGSRRTRRRRSRM